MELGLGCMMELVFQWSLMEWCCVLVSGVCEELCSHTGAVPPSVGTLRVGLLLTSLRILLSFCAIPPSVGMLRLGLVFGTV